MLYKAYLRYEQMGKAQKDLRRALDDAVEVPLVALSKEQEEMLQNAHDWQRERPTPKIFCVGAGKRRVPPHRRFDPASVNGDSGLQSRVGAADIVARQAEEDGAAVAEATLHCGAAAGAAVGGLAVCWKSVQALWAWLVETVFGCQGAGHAGAYMA